MNRWDGDTFIASDLVTLSLRYDICPRERALRVVAGCEKDSISAFIA